MSTEKFQIQISEIPVELIYKDIKNIHISVYPPDGKVKISSPRRIALETLRIYAISKLGWIRKQQNKFRSQESESFKEYIPMESHLYLGKRYLLNIIEHNGKPKVNLANDTIELYIKKKSTIAKKQAVINEWSRERLKEIIPCYINKWEKIINVTVNDFGVKKMKTRWGTCNIKAKRIWLNLELAKKPIHCLEYIIVHEMIHLLERRHNEVFKAYINKFLPRWKEFKEELNRFPIPHESWNY